MGPGVRHSAAMKQLGERDSGPFASLSLDLDNKWSYMKTHGDSGWETYPTYLPSVVPRILEFLQARQQRITFFVVGRDASREENAEALRAIVAAGHEIGNHSFEHEPWLQRYGLSELGRELDLAEEHLGKLTGETPRGFRGPGFSFSPALLGELARRGYLYDASTFPTFLGPLARSYYFLISRLTPMERKERSQLFGGLRDGLRPIRPYVWRGISPELLEIPVTTFPLIRAPIHLSYLLFLGQKAPGLAWCYFRAALAACRLGGISPSLLLHPLDFMGREDDRELAFFPGMGWRREEKLEFLARILDRYAQEFRVGTMLEHAQRCRTRTFVQPERYPEVNPRSRSNSITLATHTSGGSSWEGSTKSGVSGGS